MNGTHTQKNGSALIITLILLSVLIAVVVGIASIFVREVRLSAFVDDSILAIMAADAGIEKKLYDVRKRDGSVTTQYSDTLSNGASYITCPAAGSCVAGETSKITSEGAIGTTKRALEVTY